MAAGQLAVATVVLNRVKASNNSSSICGVVYKGANHLNACQFSFACDGKPDVPDDMRAWNTALNITRLALTSDEEDLDQQMQIVANATSITLTMWIRAGLSRFTASPRSDATFFIHKVSWNNRAKLGMQSK